MDTASQTAPASGKTAKPIRGKPFAKGADARRCPAGPGRPAKAPALRQLERITREQAAAVLERLAGPALKVLQKALAGDDEALAVRAAVDVLDRAVGKAVQRVEANVTGGERAMIVSVADLRAAAAKLLTSAAADTVDVEVVEVEPVEVDRP